PVVARHERSTGGQAERGGIVAGTTERSEADIGADAGRARQLREQRQQQRTRAGPEIDDARRTRSPTFAIERRQRRFDHGLGLRPGQQGFGIDLERQPPKFLAAENTRDRLALKPPRRKRSDGAGLRRGEHAARLGSERRVVEPKRMADDHARIELGRVETMLAKLARQPPTRGVDRAAREWVMSRPAGGPREPRHDGAPSAASSSAWCSVTSASMISPSASPSITCGSL